FDGASGFVGKAFKKLYNVPPVGGRIFLLGMICGYPVGAKLTADAYKNGELSKAGAKTVAALSSMSGPLFIISLVGASLLKNAAAAVIILISHYLSAVFCGLFFKNKTAASAAQNGGSMPPPRNLNHDSRQSGGRGDALAETVSSAITTILTVGGFIALFNMICDIALNSKILAPLSAALTLATKNESASTAVLLSFIEMTRGISDLCASKLPLPFLIPLISALVSFGGLSVTLQSLSFLKPAGVSLFTFLKIKSVQSLSAAFFASAFTLIFLFF
ncbi:MAG: hypothetical protein LBQ40_06745, partial [Clostridiales bacterium]|nr:hypothetical protein [Clostridiales bacterium]